MNNSIYIEYNSIFRPSKETIRKNKKLWETIEQNVSIQRCENGFNAEIKNLDLTFLNDIKWEFNWRWLNENYKGNGNEPKYWISY